jgi:hypothetical protein
MKYRIALSTAAALVLTVTTWGGLKQTVNAPVPPPDPPAEEAEE